MASGKKSFVAYSDWKETFDSLSDEYAGKLIKHIFAYVNDENPISEEMVINAVFSNIKHTLKRDLNKWESQIEQRKAAGKKSAEIRATKSNERSNSFNEITRNPTVSDSVNVSVNDIVVEEEKTAFDKNFNLEPKSSGIKIDDCFHKGYAAEMKTESEWVENTCRQLKLDFSKIPKALEDFNSHLISIGKKHPTKRLYKEHFISWARKSKEISESKQRQSKSDRL